MPNNDTIPTWDDVVEVAPENDIPTWDDVADTEQTKPDIQANKGLISTPNQEFLANPVIPKEPTISSKEIQAPEDSTETVKAIKSSSARALGGIVGLPSFLIDQLTAVTVKPIMKGLGYNDTEIEGVRQGLKDTPIGGASPFAALSEENQQLLNLYAKSVENTMTQYEDGIVGSIKEGIRTGDVAKFSDAGEQLWLGAVQSLPYLAMTVATSGGGTPAVLSTIGLTSSAQRYGELQDPDSVEGKKLSETGKFANSWLYGGFEAAGELVTMGLANTAKGVLKNLGKEAAEGVTDGIVKATLKGFGLEGSSEAATELGQQISDYTMDLRDNIDFKAIVDAGLIGGVTGAGISGAPTAVAKLAGRKVASDKDVAKVNENNAKIVDLTVEKENATVPEAIEIIDTEIQKAADENAKIITDNIEKASNLTKDEIIKLKDLDNAISTYEDRITNATEKDNVPLMEQIKTKLTADKDALIKDAVKRAKETKSEKITPIEDTPAKVVEFTGDELKGEKTIEQKRQSELFDMLSDEQKELASQIEDEAKRNRWVKTQVGKIAPSTKVVNGKTQWVAGGNDIIEKHKAEDVLKDPNSSIPMRIMARQKLSDLSKPFNAAQESTILKYIAEIEKGGALSKSAQEIKVLYDDELKTNTKQDGSNGKGNGISERTGYERTDETQMQGQGEQLQLGTEPNVKTEQKGGKEGKADKTEVQVEQFKKGSGGTKGTFKDENGKIYKSLIPQQAVFEDGKAKRVPIKDKLTDEHTILSELQDKPYVPKVGKVVETSEGKAFEIEELEEADNITKEEYIKLRQQINELNDNGYFISDKVSVMRRKNGELVITDFSNAYKGDRGSRDVDSMMDVEEKLSKQDKAWVDLQKSADNARKTSELFKGETKPNQYLLTQRPPSIGTHPIENIVGDPVEQKMDGRSVWKLTYSKPLSSEDIKRFELSPVLPINEYVGKIVDGVTDGFQFYVKNIKDRTVTLEAVSPTGKRVENKMRSGEFLEKIQNGELKLSEPTIDEDSKSKPINTSKTETTVKQEKEIKSTISESQNIDNRNKPVVNDKTKSETVKPIKQKELPISKVFTKATKALNLVGKETTSMLGKTARNGKINGVDVVVQQGNTDNEIIIESMRTPSSFRQKGKATKALQIITEQADKDGITLKLRAVPQKGSKITEQQLKSFYEKNGFVFDGIEGVRKPKSVETEKVAEYEIPKSEDGLYQIYPVKVRNKDGGIDNYFGVPTIENKENKGFGDGLHRNLKDAIAEAEQNRIDEVRLAKQNAERAEEQRKAEEAAQAKKEANKGKTKLELMNEAKDAKILNTKERRNGIFKTRKEHVEDTINNGGYTEIAQVNKVNDVSRTTYNRMDGRQQDDLERRIKEGGKKNEYRIFNKDGSFRIVTKAEYDYANKIVSKQSKSTEDGKEKRQGQGRQEVLTPQKESDITGDKSGNVTELTPIVEKYGWKVETENGNTALFNSKGNKAAVITNKNGKYLIAHPDGTKILSGNKNLAAAVEKTMKDYWYAKEIEQPKFPTDKNVDAKLLAQTLIDIFAEPLKQFEKGQKLLVYAQQEFLKVKGLTVDDLGKLSKDELAKMQKEASDWLKENKERLVSELEKSETITPTEEKQITKTTSIKPKNLKDVYKAGREIFGLNRSQALAQAIIVNTVVNKIAKNRGVTPEKVWSEIEFKKGMVDNGKNVLYQQAKAAMFYSPTEKALTKIQQNKGTVEQFKAMLLKNGAKQAELDWMNWDERFPDSKKSITKEEVQQWIDGNKVEVEEVTKGDYDDKTNFDRLISDLEADKNDLEYEIRNDIEKNGSVAKEKTDRLFEIEQQITDLEDERYSNTQNASTKYSQYQLPGGENYKEVLLTMPQKNIVKTESAKDGIENYGRYVYTFSDGTRIQANNKEEAISQVSNYSDNTFKSSHFDEPNILAHIRFNERTDSEGNKVLFIEEIQSDWAQKGKKEGFDRPQYTYTISPSKKYDGEFDLINDQTGVIAASGSEKFLNERKSTWEKQSRVGVSNMPFKQTPQWVNLALRRMIRYAAENGFDRIAWTNGEMQADRYDLSKQVDEIDYKKRGDKYTVQVRKGDNNIWGKREATISEIEDTVGKEIASKIQSQATDELQTLSGLDLKVGGEGMKAFYDAIVPNAAKELGKKFGARVEEIDFKNTGIEEGYETLRPAKNGKYIFTDHNTIVKEFDTEKELDEYIKKYTTTSVLSMPITESMKESALKDGMPLFQKQGTGKTAKGAIQFLADGNAIISALTNPNVSTPLHEISHLYERYMPDNERKAVLKWAKHKTWSTETSEMFARGFEKYLATGIAPTTELQKIFDRFKKWLTEIYNGITGSEIDIELNEAMTNIYGQMLGVENVKPAKKQKPVEYKKAFKDVDDLLFQSTESSAFKKWFGNSKVVDEKGSPLVVYHGTNKDFSIFDPSRSTEKNNAIFFSSDPKVAQQFSEYMAFSPSIMPVFISLKNPFIIDYKGEYLSTKEIFEIVEAQNDLHKKEYDGIIIKNTIDTYKEDIVSDIYVAFSPTQIKSATGNRGTFDPNNPNILYQGEDKTEKHTQAVNKLIDNFEKEGEKDIPKAVRDYLMERGNPVSESVINDTLNSRGYTPKFTEQYPIGTTNAKVRTSREMRGLEAIPKADRVANKDLWQSVVDKIANGTIIPRQTVKDILSTPEVETSETKEAIVKWDRWRILKETKYTVEEIGDKQNANDNTGLVDLFMRKAELEVELQENDLAAEKLGATWGKAGQFRQRNLEEDMSLAAIIREAKILNGGKELTVKQEQRFKQLSEKFEKLQAEYDKLRGQEQERQDKAKAEEDKKRKAAEQKLINDIQNNLVRQTPKAMRDFDTQFKTDVRKQKLSEKENTIKERLKERLGRLANLQFAVGEEGSAMIVEELSGVIKDMSELGIVKLEQGIDRIISKVKDYMMSVDKKFDGKNLDKYKDEIKESLGIEKVVDGEYERLITKLVEKSILGFDTSVKSILNEIVYNRVVSGRETIDDVVDDIYESVKDRIANIDKRKIRDAISGYGEFRKLSKEEADIKVRELKRQGRLDSAIEDVEDKNQLPLRTGVERDTQTQQTRQKQARILKEIKERDLVPPPTEDEQETQWRNGLQAYQRRLENAIEDIEKEIATGERKAKSQSKKYDSPELDILRTELERLKKVREAIDKESGKYVEQRESAIIKATERAIAELEMDIDKMRQGIPTDKTVTTKGKGVFGLSKAAKEKITSDKIEELRKLKESLQQQLSELMPDAIKDKALLEKYKQQRQRRLEQLLEQQRTKDYGERPKPYRPTLDKATIEINRSIERLKYDIEKEKEQIRLDNRGWRQKLMEGFLNAYSLPKALKSSIDMSAPLRQGIVMVSKPKLFGRAFAEMFKYAVSQNAYEDWLFDLKATDDYFEMMDNGLYIAEPTAKLAAKEERFMSNWLKFVDKIPVYGSLRQGSERAYIGFLNKLRIDIYRNFRDKLIKQGFEGEELQKELKSYSHFVNTATGRGKLSINYNGKEAFSLEGVSPVLNGVFFSPRLIASRLAPFNPAFYSNMTPETKKDAIRTYLATTGVILTTLSLLAVAFFDDDDFNIELDPRSSDFLKIRYKNIYYDFWGGHQQVVRTLAQVITGKTKKNGKVEKMTGDKWHGTTRWSTLTNFFINKVSPTTGMVMGMMQGGKTYDGEDMTVMGEFIDKITPLYVSDMIEVVQEEGFEFVFIAGIPTMFGVGVQTRTRKPTEGTGNTETDYIEQLPEEIPDMSFMEAIDGYEQTIPENPEWMDIE